MSRDGGQGLGRGDTIRVIHVISGLAIGGAELMLYKLLSRMDREQFVGQEVISLTGKGGVGEKIEALGIKVHAMGMRRRPADIAALWRLRGLIRQRRPDVVQTWMYHADLLGGIAARLAGNAPVIWNIRHSNLESGANKRSTIWTAKACARLSRQVPRRIVCCSHASMRVHAEIGYDRGSMLVIPNGFDLGRFKPDSAAGPALRRELGVPPEALLIGMVARFNPQKDHRNLIQAAKAMRASGVDAFFVLCGQGIDAGNETLTGWLREVGMAERFFLLGPRDDMPKLTAALDLACLSSAFGEGFPNVLGEAMACGVPCVATDVGDATEIVGDTGRIVPAEDSAALAEALGVVVRLGPEGRSNLGLVARERVQKLFDLGLVAQQYEALYRDVSGPGKNGAVA